MPTQEDDRPLEPLGGVQRRQRDAVGDRRVLRVGPTLQLGDEARRGRAPGWSAATLVGHRDHAPAGTPSGRARCRGPSGRRPAVQPIDGSSTSPRPVGGRAARGVGSSVPSCRPGPPRAAASSPAAPRAGRRTARPRARRRGPPRSASASSKFSDWALMRNSTAIVGRGRCPRATSRRDRRRRPRRPRRPRRRGRRTSTVGPGSRVGSQLDRADEPSCGAPSRCWPPR